MTKKENVSPVKDPLVHNVVLLNKLPIHLHKYLYPFFVLYIILLLVWIQFFDSKRPDFAIAAAIALFLVQVITMLSCFWSCNVRVLLTCSKVDTTEEASFVKVVPTPHNGATEIIKLQRAPHKGKLRTWFEFQKVMYIYDDFEKKRFYPISFPISESFNFYQSSKGLANDEQLNEALHTYGENEMEMVIPEFKVLFQERATAPFFVFQVFCVVLWCLDEYWYYSLFTLAMLVGFECTLVQQQLRNMAEIRKMGNKSHKINVYRSRKWRQIDSNKLVAGDIVSLVRSTPQEEKLVPCDILLLRGRLIVDEAMLTGESVPQMKEPIESANGDTVLDLDAHSRVHLISGGTRIVQHDPPAKVNSSSADQSNVVTSGVSRPGDNGCVGYVLRTGFSTSQGKLLRTILFGVKRVTANNLETFAFIVFLLMFAIAAAAYVWVVGTADPERSKYKLLLNCILILTSVVPPELPIVLSLAVNSSLLALTKLYVFCTEPFRIPFAGKIDVCCFDKTGTLTSDSLMVEGIAGTDPENPLQLCAVTEAPVLTQKAVASCHALANVNDELIGDPLEQAMFNAVEWNITKADVVIPRKKQAAFTPLKIVHRFHFTSTLKRMSTIVSEETHNRQTHLICCKGAAEVLKNMLESVPANYDKVHQQLAQRGARVLALAMRDCERVFTSSEIRSMKREDIERDLQFVGFIVVSSPLKKDSKSVISEIKASSHHVSMITGDNPLTACHVGRVLKFLHPTRSLLLSNDQGAWVWKSVLESDDCEQIRIKCDKLSFKSIAKYDLCLTGDGLSHLLKMDNKYFNKVLPLVRIFARVSPKQKEQIITSMKQLNFNVVMCGDGTNDVGALKHAHVGVALLSGSKKVAGKKSKLETAGKTAIGNNKLKNRNAARFVAEDRNRNNRTNPQPRAAPARNPRQERIANQKKQLQKMLDEMQEAEGPQFVKLGDASVAAPFSYKLSSTNAVCHIIKQGRCTLVTTLQMFKILALNALILAYSQSVLSIDGVKFSDGQATLQGLLLAGCFLFISRSKPVEVLSKHRPLPNIFNLYTVLTVTFQFAVHFASLFYLVTQAKLSDPDRVVDYEAEFEANLLNSTVYILSLAIQIITFAVNYRGRPYMESIVENRSLLYSLSGAFLFLLALLFDYMPDVNDQFEIVHFTNEFRNKIAFVLFAIIGATWFVDRLLRLLFGWGSLRKIR